MKKASKVHCWGQPIGSRRWHVSFDGLRFACGAFSGDRFKGNLQVMTTAALPVLACVNCAKACLSDGQP